MKTEQYIFPTKEKICIYKSDDEQNEIRNERTPLYNQRSRDLGRERERVHRQIVVFRYFRIMFASFKMRVHAGFTSDYRYEMHAHTHT